MKFLKPYFFAYILYYPFVIHGHTFLMHGSHGKNFQESEHHHCKEEIEWSEERSKSANIEILVASSGNIENFIEVPGEIEIHPDYLAIVIPKVTGTVKEIRKNKGEQVKKDEILAIIESKEIAEAKSNYLTAVKKLELYKTLLQRETSLKGISAEQDYLNAQLAEEEALINLDLSKQYLYALGFTEDSIKKISQENKTDLRFYEIKSPIDGKILERNLTLGEMLNNKNKVFTIVNLEKVWIEFSICQNNLCHLKTDLPIEIISTNGKNTKSKIFEFNPLINEETRNATAIAIVENNVEKWTPGEFVTVKIQTSLTNSPIVIPKTAIQNIKGSNFIFVQKDNNFIVRAITLGKSDQKNAEVLSGLEKNEKYAGSNTFVLKAEYEKEESEHHH